MSGPEPGTKRNDVPKSTQKLAVQWMKGEISTGEARSILKVRQVSQCVYKLGIAIRAAWRSGMVGK